MWFVVHLPFTARVVLMGGMMVTGVLRDGLTKADGNKYDYSLYQHFHNEIIERYLQIHLMNKGLMQLPPAWRSADLLNYNFHNLLLLALLAGAMRVQLCFSIPTPPPFSILDSVAFKCKF